VFDFVAVGEDDGGGFGFDYLTGFQSCDSAGLGGLGQVVGISGAGFEHDDMKVLPAAEGLEQPYVIKKFFIEGNAQAGTGRMIDYAAPAVVKLGEIYHLISGFAKINRVGI